MLHNNNNNNNNLYCVIKNIYRYIQKKHIKLYTQALFKQKLFGQLQEKNRHRQQVV